MAEQIGDNEPKMLLNLEQALTSAGPSGFVIAETGAVGDGLLSAVITHASVMPAPVNSNPDGLQVVSRALISPQARFSTGRVLANMQHSVPEGDDYATDFFDLGGDANDEDAEHFSDSMDPYITAVLFSALGKASVQGVITAERSGYLWTVNSVISDFRHAGSIRRGNLRFMLRHHGSLVDALLESIANNACNKSAEALGWPKWALGLGIEHIALAESTSLDNLPVVQATEGILDDFETVEITEDDPFADFIGIDHIVQELREFVVLANEDPQVLQEAGIEAPRVVLLHGPSGTGKTPLAEALADALGAERIVVTYDSVADPYVGNWGKNVAAVFNQAFATEGRKLIIINEADGKLSTGNSGTSGNVWSVLKEYLEEIKGHPGVFLAMTSNHKDVFDPDVLDSKRVQLIIQTELPDEDAIKQMLWQFLKKGKTHDQTLELLKIDYDALALESAGLSGSELHQIVKRLAGSAYAQWVQNGKIGEPKPPTQQQILAAIKKRLSEKQPKD